MIFISVRTCLGNGLRISGMDARLYPGACHASSSIGFCWVHTQVCCHFVKNLNCAMFNKNHQVFLVMTLKQKYLFYSMQSSSIIFFKFVEKSRLISTKHYYMIVMYRISKHSSKAMLFIKLVIVFCNIVLALSCSAQNESSSTHIHNHICPSSTSENSTTTKYQISQ